LCRAAVPTAAAATAQVDASAFEEFLLEAQKQILSDAEQLDGSGQNFVHDRWERPGDNAGTSNICSIPHIAYTAWSHWLVL
jgi:coproporphyrinogen III oxidase